MEWVLIMVWTASYVTTSQTVPMQTKELCEGAAHVMMANWVPPQGRQDTKLQTFCIQVKRASNDVE